MIISHNPNGGKFSLPDTIVIHCMSEYLTKEDGDRIHAVDFLLEQGLSAHALVTPDGEIFRCREDTEGAYHAKGFNSNSLGIEFLVRGLHNYDSFVTAIKTPYLTDKQFEAGITQCKEWLAAFKIIKVTRHSDLSPGRKVDPGFGFPWRDFLKRIGR